MAALFTGMAAELDTERAARDSGQRVTQGQDVIVSQTYFYVAQSSRRCLKELGRTSTIQNKCVTLELPEQEVSTTEGYRTTQEAGTRLPGCIANWAPASEPLLPSC